MAAGQRGSGQAGNGVTLTAGELWTPIDGTNFVVRSQATDLPFTAEYAQWRGKPRMALRSASTVVSNIGKPTFNGTYNGVTARVYFAAFVSTTNATPGSLTGTVVTWTLINADTAATVASGTASAWSGSSDTKLLTQGVSLTLTFTGSEQFIAGTNAIMWLRTYTTTLTDGVDYFPEGCKVASGLVLSNSSGGANNYTSGVDYDLVSNAHVNPNVSSTTGYFSAALDWGGTGACSGIHWKTAGSPPAAGANYFIPASYQVYNGYYQVPNVVSIGGNFSLTGAPMDFWDPVLGAGRFVLQSTGTPKTTINTTESFGQLFTGAAQPGSTFINFWISVKSDKIVMVFRGDTGQSGRAVVLTYQRYTTLVTSDKWPWLFVGDGSIGGSRGGGIAVMSKYNYEQPYYGLGSVSLGSISLPVYYGPQTTVGPIVTGITNESTGTMPDQNPNNWDLRWWLYSIYIRALLGGSNLAGTFDATRPQAIRGKLRGIFAVANDNFTSLDELVDGASTYLLVVPTSNWGQMTGAGQVYLALGILEE
jgi:hypothetical protein